MGGSGVGIRRRGGFVVSNLGHGAEEEMSKLVRGGKPLDAHRPVTIFENAGRSLVRICAEQTLKRTEQQRKVQHLHRAEVSRISTARTRCGGVNPVFGAVEQPPWFPNAQLANPAIIATDHPRNARPSARVYGEPTSSSRSCCESSAAWRARCTASTGKLAETCSSSPVKSATGWR